MDLLEEDQELIGRYEQFKEDKVVMVERDNHTDKGMYATFTLEEILRLSKLIER